MLHNFKNFRFLIFFHLCWRLWFSSFFSISYDTQVFSSLIRYKFLSLSQSALSNDNTQKFFCDTILYFITVTFPIGTGVRSWGKTNMYIDRWVGKLVFWIKFWKIKKVKFVEYAECICKTTMQLGKSWKTCVSISRVIHCQFYWPSTSIQTKKLKILLRHSWQTFYGLPAYHKHKRPILQATTVNFLFYNFDWVKVLPNFKTYQLGSAVRNL